MTNLEMMLNAEKRIADRKLDVQKKVLEEIENCLNNEIKALLPQIQEDKTVYWKLLGYEDYTIDDIFKTLNVKTSCGFRNGYNYSGLELILKDKEHDIFSVIIDVKGKLFYKTSEKDTTGSMFEPKEYCDKFRDYEYRHLLGIGAGLRKLLRILPQVHDGITQCVKEFCAKN